PLAIVVIGGLLSSTLLTLVLVPTLYAMVEHTKELVRALGARSRRTPAPVGPSADTARRGPSGPSSPSRP
ncbi:hypothetical protein QTQ03_28970, partial [Micromonospora sp. WMMA1363]|uniref:hypothetical protein n=1 Tax=Micromonospora sp. WMMA1363 TaxID=3053985 RepID=UPI00259CCBD7